MRRTRCSATMRDCSYPWQEDIVYYENSKGVFPTKANTYASWLSNKMGHGGYWFWVPGDAGQPPSKSVQYIDTGFIKRCDPLWCASVPCIDPNNQGLIQPEYVTWLSNSALRCRPIWMPIWSPAGPGSAYGLLHYRRQCNGQQHGRRYYRNLCQ